MEWYPQRSIRVPYRAAFLLRDIARYLWSLVRYAMSQSRLQARRRR